MFNKILISLGVILLATLASASPISEAINSKAYALQADINAVNAILATQHLQQTAYADPDWEGEITIRFVKDYGITRQQYLEKLYSLNIALINSPELQDVFHINVECFSLSGDQVASTSLYVGYQDENSVAKSLVDGTIFWDEFGR